LGTTPENAGISRLTAITRIEIAERLVKWAQIHIPAKGLVSAAAAQTRRGETTCPMAD
jgi:hypothetical protein